MKRYAKIIVAGALLPVGLSACGAISATTVRCGTDGDSSYFELVSAPQQIANSTRALGEACGFAYEKEKE